MPPIILSIAGFDPSSGAGTTADTKTAAAHGCYTVSCITALTVQSTRGVRRVEPVSPRLVAETLQELAEDVEISAVRIGMLGSGEVARAVAEFLKARKLPNVVLDPVLKSSSGMELLDRQGQEVMIELFPLADVITPNIDEASSLAGTKIQSLEEMRVAARLIQAKGAENVLITGGHLADNTDLLRLQSGEEHEIRGPKIESNATHGTGCALATALACNLALGTDLLEAARAAKQFVREAIAAAYPVGKGAGPLNHLYRIR